MSKESKMANKGHKQGDMNPAVDDYARPMSVYSQEGFSKTTAYEERHNAFETKEASAVKKQAYKGRYS